MRKQSTSFRQRETEYVMRAWAASESCNLVGVGSVGKSNFLQHLADPDTRQNYGLTSLRITTIILDPYLLGPLPETPDKQFRVWAAYELMMHRLYMAFYPFKEFGEEASLFYEAYQALQDGTNPLFAYMGIRYFELGLQFLLKKDHRLIFMFDEFDAWLRLMPPALFQGLRGLRDNYKSQLMYLTFTRKPLLDVIDDLSLNRQELEPFYELFTDNTFYIGPYADQDAQDMLSRLEQRNQLQLPEHVKHFLLTVSGNHAGLLRAAFKSRELVQNLPQQYDYTQALAALANSAHLQTEAQVIWDSLNANEQTTLNLIVRNQPLNTTYQQSVADLVAKGLLTTNRKDHTLQIMPPLFRVFIANDKK